jgi:FixJ family two-component response regulator
MMNPEPCKIYIIDDDPAILQGLSLLLTSAGYQTEVFRSAEEFFPVGTTAIPGCILLDVFLEGSSGLELQEEIRRRFEHLPIIYMSGYGDIPMSVLALKKGAVNFLEKPVDDLNLLWAVNEAIEISRRVILDNDETAYMKTLINSLTPREFEIFRLLISGMMNKQIAAELSITEHTVKLHRGKITEKLGFKSVAEMVRLAGKLRIPDHQ